MSLPLVIHRVASDPSFADSLLHDPISTLKSAGLELREDELAALRTLLSRPDWQRLCSSGEAGAEPYPWMTNQSTPAAA